jgi:hypothetical protein
MATERRFLDSLVVILPICFSLSLYVFGTTFGQDFLSYRNNLTGIQVGYPGNWIYRDFSNGVTFIPANESKLDRGLKSSYIPYDTQG